MANVNQRKILTKYRRLIFAGFAIVAIVIACLIGGPRLNRRIVGEHQRNVIRELDRWADEYAVVTDRDSAIRSANMIGYISTHYTPCDGYRSDDATEQRLQVARQRSMTQIADALSEYTGIAVADPLDWPAEMSDNAAGPP
ncbi:hypothetical protein EC9_28970 [Rosistilla ulvae]|uniref:Uncharacterized protein n=1 Tax=Rosistilla ulvae TaxID=1930277 RepID=A0A517M1F1_9BACT|nr:hypothetical protein [Rosistilla ulvae]QDS88705.1 hypothetical protein EC9_28970 [Rosistilla ulvae]